MPWCSLETDSRYRARVGGFWVCCSRRRWLLLCFIPAQPLRRRQNRSSCKDMAKLYASANPDKPDPKVEAQAAAVAKKNGFANLDEYDDASMNISMIMSGIDPQTRKFTEPPEQIKKEIAALKADKSVPEAEKKEDLAELEASLKTAKPIQFKENIALVLKYFDKLAPLMQDSNQRPAD